MSEIIANKMTFNSPICNKCKNHVLGLKCKAFAEIPDEILSGENNHSKPLNNQNNNIIFDPIEK